jgi:hypothetical protein
MMMRSLLRILLAAAVVSTFVGCDGNSGDGNSGMATPSPSATQRGITATSSLSPTRTPTVILTRTPTPQPGVTRYRLIPSEEFNPLAGSIIFFRVPEEQGAFQHEALEGFFDVEELGESSYRITLIAFHSRTQRVEGTSGSIFPAEDPGRIQMEIVVSMINGDRVMLSGRGSFSEEDPPVFAEVILSDMLHRDPEAELEYDISIHAVPEAGP